MFRKLHIRWSTATITFAGSGGTLANCQLISDTFGDAVTVADTTGNAYGCHQAKKTNTYRSTDLTNASAAGNDIYRYCACNN